MKVSHKYVDVILPVPVEGTFTYLLSYQFKVDIGHRVVVQFGPRKLYTAIVVLKHNETPKEYDTKEVIAVLDEFPIVKPEQIKFWSWISSYYMCSLGNVMQLALPSSLKLASESKVVIHDNFDGEMTDFNNNEISIVSALEKKDKLSISEISEIVKKKHVFNLINNLILKEIVFVEEELHERYNEKIIRIIDFTEKGRNIDMSILKNAPKQKEFLRDFSILRKLEPDKRWTVLELIKNTAIGRSSIKSLLEKKILMIEEQIVSRLVTNQTLLEDQKKLSGFQRDAYLQIKDLFKTKTGLFITWRYF